LKKIIKKQFFNNIGLTCNFAELTCLVKYRPTTQAPQSKYLACGFTAGSPVLSGTSLTNHPQKHKRLKPLNVPRSKAHPLLDTPCRQAGPATPTIVLESERLTKRKTPICHSRESGNPEASSQLRTHLVPHPNHNCVRTLQLPVVGGKFQQIRPRSRKVGLRS